MTETRPNRPHGHIRARGTAFAAGFAMMAVELLAARIAAPYIGNSLYTWTAVIASVMAGVAIGAWIGGWLADVRPNPSTLFAGISASAALIAASPFIAAGIGSLLAGMSWPISVLALCFATIVFFPPALALGALTPQLVRADLTSVETSGSVYGGIGAWNAIGSILGTYATGFGLIGFLPTRISFFLLAAALVVWGAAAHVFFRKEGLAV